MIRTDRDYVIFTTDNGWGYEIPLRDLKTQEGLQQWINHMTLKNWFMPYMAEQLINIAEYKFGYEFNGEVLK